MTTLRVFATNIGGLTTRLPEIKPADRSKPFFRKGFPLFRHDLDTVFDDDQPTMFSPCSPRRCRRPA